MGHYDAFISYSHAGDGRLAPRLQSGLQRFARPWWKPRVLRVFRDETGLSASPHLWDAIAGALDEAEWFILLASPESARSVWVGREIEHWTTRRDPARILVAVTDGTFVWDEAASDIDWARSTAAHPSLRGVFRAEPRHIDLTWARSEIAVDRRDGRFQDALAELAAPIRGVPKDEIAGEDVRQYRRTLRLARGAVAALALLFVAAVVASIVAIRQRDTADAQRARADKEAVIAVARSASASAIALANVSLDRALLLGAAGVGLSPSDDTASGLLTALDAAALLSRFHHHVGPVNALDVNGAGDELVTVSAEGALQVWSYPGMELVRRTVVDDGGGVVHDVQFVAGGAVLAVWSDAGVARLDAATLEPEGELLEPRQVPGEEVLAVIALGDDASAAALAELGGSEFELRDVGGGPSRSVEVDERCDGIRDLEVHSETNRVVAVCETWIGFYDALTGELVATRDTLGAVRAVFSPDGAVLAVAFVDDQVILIDVASFEKFGQLDAPGTRVYAHEFSPDGRFLAIGADNGAVDVYELLPTDPQEAPSARPGARGDAVFATSFAGIDGGVRALKFMRGTDPSAIPPIVTGGRAGVAEWDTTRVPSFATASFRPSFDPDIVHDAVDAGRREVYRTRVSLAEPTATTTTFEVVGFDGDVRRTLELGGGAVQILEFVETSQGPRLLATGAAEWPVNPADAPGLLAPTRFDLQVVDALTGDVMTTIDLAAASPITIDPTVRARFAQTPQLWPGGLYAPSVRGRISPDGTRAVVEGVGPTTVWDLTSGSPVATGNVPAVDSGAWTPDGSALLVGAGGGRLDLYRAADLSLVRTAVLRPGYTISHVARGGALGDMIVTVESGEVYVLDVPSLETIGEPFSASGIQLQRSAVSARGDLLASVDRTGDLRLWRADTRTPLGPPITVGAQRRIPEVSEAGPLSVGFTDDELWIQQFLHEGLTAAVLPSDLSALATRACQLAGRQLTPDEWERYLGAQPRTPCGVAG